MKKRIKFLSFISSILAVVSICGLSLFSFLGHKKETQRVSAVDSITYFSYNADNRGVDVYNYQNDDYEYRYSYSIEYKHFLDTNKYGYQIVINNWLFYSGEVQDFYLFNGSAYALFNYSGVVGFSDEIQDFSRLKMRLLLKKVNQNIVNSPFNQVLYSYSLQLYMVIPGPHGEVIRVIHSYDFNMVFNTGVQYKDIGGTLYVVQNPGVIFQTNDDVDVVLFDFTSITLDENEYDVGFTEGYDSGYNEGYNDGVSSGYSSGYDVGYDLGKQEGYSSGYTVGYNEGVSTNGTAITIMSGIFQIALVPVNFFLGMFNFEILGVNLANFIQAIFTIAITIILVKAVIGSKGE